MLFIFLVLCVVFFALFVFVVWFVPSLCICIVHSCLLPLRISIRFILLLTADSYGLCLCVLDTTLCDKCFSDLRQVGGFLRVLRFPPPIKLIVESGVKHHKPNHHMDCTYVL